MNEVKRWHGANYYPSHKVVRKRYGKYQACKLSNSHAYTLRMLAEHKCFIMAVGKYGQTLIIAELQASSSRRKYNYALNASHCQWS
jgi:hypothetical protein